MNAGVSMTPCGVVRRPRRAPVGSVARTSNLNPSWCDSIRASVSGESSREPDLDRDEEDPRNYDEDQGPPQGEFLRIGHAVANCQQDQRPEGKNINRTDQRDQPFGGFVRKK